ncbi:hypothetical protein ACLB2K_025080 [Fragaria x ananassa]
MTIKVLSFWVSLHSRFVICEVRGRHILSSIAFESLLQYTFMEKTGTSNGVAWFENIFQKFEDMYNDVDELMKQAESQLVTTGATVKNCFSEFDLIGDALPQFSEDKKPGGAPDTSVVQKIDDAVGFKSLVGSDGGHGDKVHVDSVELVKSISSSLEQIDDYIEKKKFQLQTPDKIVSSNANQEIGLDIGNKLLIPASDDVGDCKSFTEREERSTNLVDMSSTFSNDKKDSSNANQDIGLDSGAKLLIPASDQSDDIGGFNFSMETEEGSRNLVVMSSKISEETRPSNALEVGNPSNLPTSATEPDKLELYDGSSCEEAETTMHIPRSEEQDNDVTDSSLQILGPLEKVELGESCILVDCTEVECSSGEAANRRSYKKKLKDAFASKVRLLKKHNNEQERNGKDAREYGGELVGSLFLPVSRSHSSPISLTRVAHVLPVSDGGGSTAEIVRVLFGDIRSRCLRLADKSTSEAVAVRQLLGHRLPLDARQVKPEWYDIVEGDHSLWTGVSKPYRETIRAFLVYFQNQILRRSDESFCFGNGSIGNFFFAGALVFFRSLDAAIFLFSRVSDIPSESLVLPVISTNDRLTLGCELSDGTIIRGQNEISHPTKGYMALVNKGVRRQIGDGQRTNIWYDPWLKGEELLQFRSTRFNKVSNLLLSPGVWNVGVLQELFPASIVSKILVLPISSKEHQDRWIWSEDKLGKFFVKTAYHLARKRVLDHELYEHVPNPSSLLWNKLWKAKVLGKVKVCAWKAVSNILPTRSRLSERGVDIDTQCPFCEEEVESPIHALRDCSHATECVQLAQVPLLPNTTSVYDWLVSALSVPTIFPILLMLLWAIWRNRNQKVWKGEVKQASEIVSLALVWWEDYKKARSSLNERRIVFRSRWTKPSVGFVKLNVDAVFDPNSGRTGLGGVFCDHEGLCLGAFTKFIVSASSPQHSELLAVLEGVGWAQVHHLLPLVVETDWQVLVNVVQSGSLDHSSIGFLLPGLRESLRLASNARLIFVKREANSIAHALAQYALFSQMNTGFSLVIPLHVEELISLDCNDL